MTTNSDITQTGSEEDMDTNSKNSGLDAISIIIIIICCLLIITVLLISLWYWMRNKKLRQFRERQSAEMQKSGGEHEIEVDIKIEPSNPTKLKNTKNKEMQYIAQQDTIPKSDEKESSSIYRSGERSHSISTSRNFLNTTENALGSHKSDKKILIDFMQDESEVHHVDVSFKGGDNDKSMITYEKRIGNLPLNKEITGKQIIENKLYRNSNNSKNGEVDESRFSDDEENNSDENKEDIIRHYEKMSKNMFNYNDEFEIKENKVNLNYNNSNVYQQNNFAHGIDDNQYMTANFVQAIEDFENNIEGGNRNNKSFGKKDSFDNENERYKDIMDNYNGEDPNKIFEYNSMRDSTSYINNIGNKIYGGK